MLLAQILNCAFIAIARKFWFTLSYWTKLFSFKHKNISSVDVFLNGIGKGMPGNPIKLDLNNGNFSDRYYR